MAMTSQERVVTTLQQHEPDRVPLFFPLTMHGASELDLSIQEYFAQPETVVEGQLRMLRKYRHDFLYTFFYAAVEIEAWGGDILYVDDGPPNAGQPFIRTPDQINTLAVPNVKDAPSLRRVLEATQQLRQRVGDSVPIIGVVMSPFSLPVMQMGFEHYIELLYEAPELLKKLMVINEAFCIDWANAQLEAGATAIGYFDPVSSPTIIPRDMYEQTGFGVACRVLSQINGPVAMLFASAHVQPTIDLIAQTGAALVGASTSEDLADMKAACQGRMTVVGNLNAIEMCRWSAAEAEAAVKQAIASAARGGGFILSDNHGEIPWQVPESVLLAIADAVEQWGTYPLEWLP